MSVSWVTIEEAGDGWLRWAETVTSGEAATGLAKTEAHCIEDARLVLRARERENGIGPALDIAFEGVRK
jgi:hypothetical protein